MQKKEIFHIESDECEFNLSFYEKIFKSLKDQLEVHKQSSDIQFELKNNLFFLYKGIKSRLNLQKIKKDLFDQTFSVKLINKEVTSIMKKGSRTLIRFIQCVSKENENLFLRIVKYKYEKKFVVIHFFERKKNSRKSTTSANTNANNNKIAVNTNNNIPTNNNIKIETTENTQSKASSKNEETLVVQHENSQTFQIQQCNLDNQLNKQQEQVLKLQSPPSLNISLNSSIQITDSIQKKANSKEKDIFEKLIQEPLIQSSQSYNLQQQQIISIYDQPKKEALSFQNENDLQRKLLKQAEQISQLRIEKNTLANQLRMEMQKSLHFEDLYLQLRSYIVKEKFNSLKQNGFKYPYSDNDFKQYAPSDDFSIKHEENQINQIELE
ncbi:hypothetical protein TTHERM_00036890 (macronuclear) [Tetrahymena thermophila SB210]|uniref:Uncharacterized protein n=1 Tax=Tetrahymena thermophila (strain SB210) TaxID=312017 RepID=Q22MD0_TETTS|nr:hypothetical protein TTHERM_00036890 [Tetrahymena thermophila SB210]EAR86320.1 hypothetical protein TTHERM_00036890 [Tetrahymena thermophila SB210]|eukprot:XP_977090.1 hypothetical protein TTHERM_00036890 [Tetrahymena thermophila SB210]